MNAKVSGYLSLFNDWDALPAALASVAPFLDEIVVVDGAYEWMIPFLDQSDPTRSRERAYDALSSFSSKVTVIRRVWADEFEKRQAGYSLCSNRYILRFDADEVFFVNLDSVERFLLSDAGVAEVEIPIAITPEFIRARPSGIERVGVMFDKERITARQHLDYLWLVLPKHLGQKEADPTAYFPEALGFTPHLTAWRTPESAVGRALFYSLLHVKNYGGASWLGGHDLFNDPQVVFRDVISQAEIRSWMLSQSIVAGPLSLDGAEVFPMPLAASQRAIILPIFDQYQRALAESNLGLSKSRTILNGGRISLDITTQEAFSALGRSFSFSKSLKSCGARVQSLSSTSPFVSENDVSVELRGTELALDIEFESGYLQRTLLLTPYAHDDVFMSFTKA